MTSKKKFDIVLCSGPYGNDRGTFKEHMARHLHLIDSPGYYAEIILDGVIRKDPSILSARHSRFSHIATIRMTKTKYCYLWKK